MAGGIVLLQRLMLPPLSDPVLLVTLAASGTALYGLLMLATRRPRVMQMVFLVYQGFSRSSRA